VLRNCFSNGRIRTVSVNEYEYNIFGDLFLFARLFMNWDKCAVSSSDDRTRRTTLPPETGGIARCSLGKLGAVQTGRPTIPFGDEPMQLATHQSLPPARNLSAGKHGLYNSNCAL
jgi:hypothetical protein